VPDRFPLRNVGLFSGDGAIGKSILLMQLGVAHILAKDRLSTLPEPGPFLYLNAEEEEDELERRFTDVAAYYGASLAELKDHLHVLSLAGQDAVLGYPDRNGLSDTAFRETDGSRMQNPAEADRTRHLGRHLRRQRERPLPSPAVHRTAA
jgi:hypothetical protein